MKNLIRLIIITAIFSACTQPNPKDLEKETLIPKPIHLTATGSSFSINEKTVIYFQEGNTSLEWIGNYFSDFLSPATGFQLKVVKSDDLSERKGIFLSLLASPNTNGSEWYDLKIEEDKVHLTANKEEGIFWGLQTLKQLFPAAIESSDVQAGPWEIATGNITDAPKYAYRGAMLDVSRHFFNMEDVKKYIDYLAMYKMNILHMHLSDDQGWRIEIKSWPNLTKHGGSTEVGGGESGYYTQEEYSEIVKYAQDRYITIVPEIDMPGHTNAALASYGELNPDNKPTELYTGTKVGFSTFDVHKDITYKFIDDVIGEIAALTPGPYFHIGGDESHATKKDDYILFINKVQEIVKSHDKQMLGWADISAGSLYENSIAQFWQMSPKTALKAVEQNTMIIMSPANRAYLDMKYDSLSPLGLNWAGYINVKNAYDWDLESLVEGIPFESILGIEAPLWSETVETLDDIEYLTFPRLLGYSELGWSSHNDKSWDEYKMRLAKQKERFELMDINYFKSPMVPWDKEK